MSQDSIAELKPCPFCGSGDVELRETITDAGVACNNCGCRTGLVQLGRDEASAAFRKREVVTIWNTRTQPPACGSVRQAIATALYDTLHTARLSEHPEDEEEYGQLADGLVVWLKVRGYEVVAQPPACSDGLVERVAEAMKGSASICSAWIVAIAHGTFSDYDWWWLASAAIAAMPGADRITVLEADNAKLREALVETDAHIRLMQRDVLAYLPPDSTMSESDLVGLLIERLDGPEQRRVQELARAALSDTQEDQPS